MDDRARDVLQMGSAIMRAQGAQVDVLLIRMRQLRSWSTCSIMVAVAVGGYIATAMEWAWGAHLMILWPCMALGSMWEFRRNQRRLTTELRKAQARFESASGQADAHCDEWNASGDE